MIKKIQNIYYVAVDNVVLPESLTFKPVLFPLQLPNFLAQTSSSSLSHQYKLSLTSDSAE